MAKPSKLHFQESFLLNENILILPELLQIIIQQNYFQ